MPELGRFARELRARLWKPSIDEEVGREIDYHLEMLERDLIARGLDPAAARVAARQKFGDPTPISAECRDIGRRRDREMRRSESLAELSQDVRHTLRHLRANPRFTLVAVLTLAVGLGAATTIFGVANAVLLRPFPAAHPERLVLGYSVTPTGRQFVVSEPDYLDLRARLRSVTGIAAFASRAPVLRTDDGPEQLVGAATTHSLFGVLGIAPTIGRTFAAAEDLPGGDTRVAVIGHALWQRRFSGDRDVLSRWLELDGVRHRIIGVMPRGFDFPGRVDVWVPLAPSPAFHRDDRRLNTVARLAPGVPEGHAAAELAAAARQLAAEYPATNAGWGARLRPFADWYITPQLRARVVALLAAVGLLLVMACVNVASLLLARAGTRQREMAVRSALGAGRGRIIRQLLTESVALSILGAVAGVVAAAGAVPVVREIGSAAIPRLAGMTLDWRVLTFALGACLSTGILFGLAPALHLVRAAGSRGDGMIDVLRSGARTVGGGQVRSTLVVTSVALAMLLLVSAGLVGGSFVRLMRVSLGFSPEHVLAASIALPAGSEVGGRPDQVARFFGTLQQRLEQIPGVRAAGAISIAPLSGVNSAMGFEPAGQAPGREGDYRLASWRVVTPSLFAALDIPLVRGRLFDDRDRSPAPDVMIVNQAMARFGWAGADPVGQQVKLESGRTATVVGVVGDTRHLFADSLPPPTMYFAHGQFAWRSMWIAVRAAGDPGDLAGAVRRTVAALDPATPVTRIQPLSHLVRDTTAESRLTVLVFAIFASAALVLAAIGLYGIVSYTVTQRSREIGVRVALGAPTRHIVQAVLAQGVRLTATGVVLGAIVAYGAGGVLRTILFETKPTDASTFIAVAAILFAVAGVASAVPARRAARVDPMVALRSE